jgi:formate dehydrogenase major subunit
MRPLDLLRSWPLVRQAENDSLARAATAQSRHSRELRPHTDDAKVTRSICPYCAVGCGQLVYSKGDRVVQIEGDPDSPISRGRLCPKGSASNSLVNGPSRELTVKYRRPRGTEWEDMPLDEAMDRIGDRLIESRDEGWQDVDEHGKTLRRSLGVANLGGATLDNEENYLIKKLLTGLGIVQVENQARI